MAFIFIISLNIVNFCFGYKRISVIDLFIWLICCISSFLIASISTLYWIFSRFIDCFFRFRFVTPLLFYFFLTTFIIFPSLYYFTIPPCHLGPWLNHSLFH